MDGPSIESLTCFVATFGVVVLILYCSKPDFVQHKKSGDLDWTKTILYSLIPAALLCALFSMAKKNGGSRGGSRKGSR
jgi:hypothetical protein